MCVIGMGWCQREILQISDLTSRGIIIVISVSFFTVLNSPELICKVIFPIEATTCILYTGNSLLMDTSAHGHLRKMNSCLYLLPLLDSLVDEHLPEDGHLTGPKVST